MADDRNDSERSEDPTQKRLDEALQRGDVAKSQEVSTWFVIAGATLVMAAFSNTMSGSLSTTMRGLLANAHQIPVDGRGLIAIAGRIVRPRRQRQRRPLPRDGSQDGVDESACALLASFAGEVHRVIDYALRAASRKLRIQQLERRWLQSRA